MHEYLVIQMVQDVEASYMAIEFVIKYLKCGSVHSASVHSVHTMYMRNSCFLTFYLYMQRMWKIAIQWLR